MGYRGVGQRANSSIGRVRREEIWKLRHKRGWSMAEIARGLQISHELVRYYLRTDPPHGWNPPREEPKAEVVELRPRAGKPTAQ